MTQTQFHFAMLSCAAERYRIATGVYPQNLENLVPKYLNHIPSQVVNGEPYHSLINTSAQDTFLLWSVGWNLQDNGGDVGKYRKLDVSSPDWPWLLKRPTR